VRTLLAAGVPIAMLMLAGCSDSSGPRQNNVSIYALESIGPRALPLMLDSTATEWDVLEWDSLKIDFRADTTFETRMTTQHFATLDELDETWNADAVESHGDSVLLTPRLCVGICASREGLLGDSSLRLKLHYELPDNPEYAYRLVPSSP
jgi:hypothetical protein